MVEYLTGVLSMVAFMVTSPAARLRGEACGVARPMPATAAECSACGSDINAVGPTSILDRRQFI